MRMSSLLLAGAAALGVAVMSGAGGAEEGPGTFCQKAASTAVQLAQTEEGKKILTCCFEDAKNEACSINSPNQMGCEWTLLYQCKDGKYTCDAETKTCHCDEPGGGVTSTP